MYIQSRCPDMTANNLNTFKTKPPTELRSLVIGYMCYIFKFGGSFDKTQTKQVVYCLFVL